jgi:predicted amidohydrolase
MSAGKDYDWNTPPSATGARPRLTVATCQFPVGHDITANSAHIVRLIKRAAAAGADVAHFPECAISGYGAAAWPSWDGFDWRALEAATAAVQAAARACGIWVVVGSIHRESPAQRPTNCVHVFDRQGESAGRYDKRRCSMNDLRAFAPGERPLILEIEGVRCGVLICLDWAFPELWQEQAAAGVELVFHSCVSDDHRADKNHAHTIPALMQGYAFLHQFAISLANSARPRQDFPSLWVERSGHRGRRCRRDAPGLVLNALTDDAAQDRFFDMVRRFRAAASDGSLYAPHRAATEPDGAFVATAKQA